MWSAARQNSPTNRRRLMAWLALLGLAFHSLLPLSYNAMQRAMAEAARSSGIEQIVICTALGIRTITLSEALPPAAGDETPAKPQPAERSCPICLASAGLAHAVLPAGLLLAMPAGIAAALAPPSDYRSPQPRAWLPSRARAPPAPSV
ncbi:DUF2946 family protein [Ferrovibrio sp.]|uniref:DUF2946 family protein n=2 Tax=Ferrovibrio sp. TaxID=1917215 RepID=UPI003514B4CB